MQRCVCVCVCRETNGKRLCWPATPLPTILQCKQHLWQTCINSFAMPASVRWPWRAHGRTIIPMMHWHNARAGGMARGLMICGLVGCTKATEVHPRRRQAGCRHPVPGAGGMVPGRMIYGLGGCTLDLNEATQMPLVACETGLSRGNDHPCPAGGVSSLLCCSAKCSGRVQSL